MAGKLSKKKVAQATATSGVDGGPSVAEVVGEELEFDSPYCTVQVTLRATRGLENYSSVSYGASITVPCKAEDVDAAHAIGYNWLEEKMQLMRDDILGGDE